VRPVPPQVIPRPATARPGAPAPWADLGRAARSGITVAGVRAVLEQAGQSGPAALPVGGVDGAWDALFAGPSPTGAPRAAAVLVALFDEAGEARVVLTRRSSSLRSHRGEVSFPGGRLDPGETVVSGARREAHEEIGLEPASAEPFGWLQPVLTYGSGSLIVPVVAALAARPEVHANQDEVERIFDVALADLLADGVFHEERWTLPGRRVRDAPDGSYPVWFFETAGEMVWGATARILTELLVLVTGRAAAADAPYGAA
jgi:8-oxo-dGTP pyrophosphatase MutT (NUDIX family)